MSKHPRRRRGRKKKRHQTPDLSPAASVALPVATAVSLPGADLIRARLQFLNYRHAKAPHG